MANDNRAPLLAVSSGVDASTTKKSYRAPMLQVLGQLRQLTQGAAGSVGDAGTALMPKSERRTKQNIVRVGSHQLGFGLYLFDYKPEFRGESGEGRQFGVMVDEVEPILPAAIVLGADGFKRVNYEMLGIVR